MVKADHYGGGIVWHVLTHGGLEEEVTKERAWTRHSTQEHPPSDLFPLYVPLLLKFRELSRVPTSSCQSLWCADAGSLLPVLITTFLSSLSYLLLHNFAVPLGDSFLNFILQF